MVAGLPGKDEIEPIQANSEGVDGLRRTRRRAGEGMNRLFDPPRGLVVPGVTGGAMTARSTRTRGRRAQTVIDVHFPRNGVVWRRSSWKGAAQTAPPTVHRWAKFDGEEDCAISEAVRARWRRETLVRQWALRWHYFTCFIAITKRILSDLSRIFLSDSTKFSISARDVFRAKARAES